MKNIIIFTLIIVLSAATGFTKEPGKDTEKAINNYLQALKNPNSTVHLDALNKLNDLKALYPNYKMKEFDKFLTSSIMKKSTNAWLESLSSENASIRHSALHVIVQFKSDFPQLDMNVFKKALSKISNKDPQMHLQVDAKIALVYLDNPELASTIKLDPQSGPGDVFTLIHTEMDKAFASENPELR